MSKLSTDTREFTGDKAIVELDVVRDKNSVRHEFLERVGNIGEIGCVFHHRWRDAREPRYSRWNSALRVQQGLETINDLPVADFDRANFRHAVPIATAARSLDVDDDV